MKDGSGGEIRKGDDARIIHKYNERNTDGRRFGEAVAKVGIAQLCERLGFQSFHSSAIETLSDIALRYIFRIGREAHLHSDLAGRTTSTLLDLLRGLQDVNSVHGFSGASYPFQHSGLVRDIALYIDQSEDGSLMRRLPSFPVPSLPSTTSKTLSFSQSGLEPPAVHIPSWLPPFPDPKAYVNASSSFNSQETVLPLSKDLPLVESTTAPEEEKSSVSMQYELHHWNSFHVTEDEPFPSGKLNHGDERNSISGLCLPGAENTSGETSFSLIDIFSPAVEAVKRVPDLDEGNVDLGKSLLLEQRRNVRLRIGIGRTMSVNEANMYARIEGARKVGEVHLKEVEKDERRKRAEKILKECMDNPNELAQM